MQIVLIILFVLVMFIFVRPKLLKAQKQATTVMLPRKK